MEGTMLMFLKKILTSELNEDDRIEINNSTIQVIVKGIYLYYLHWRALGKETIKMNKTFKTHRIF